MIKLALFALFLTIGIILWNRFFSKTEKNHYIDKVIKDNDVAMANLREVSKLYDIAVQKQKEHSKRKAFNSEHKEILRELTWNHNFVMDNENDFKQGEPMNISLTNGLHCIAHHVFWDDMEDMRDDDRLQLDFYYKGKCILMTELNTARENVKAKILNKEDFNEPNLIDETYVKCMSPLIKKFEIRFKKYEQEKELANKECEKQNKIKKEKNKNKLNEFLGSTTETIAEPRNYVTLKWGTTKSYSFPDKPEALELINELNEIDENFTGPTNGLRNPQSDRQKEILCELIDLSDGDTIYLHWDGKDVSKEVAKDYVNNYGKE